MNLESKKDGIARETGQDFIMNRNLARVIVCLMDDKLKLPSMMLESLEENLVKGNFDKVYEYYCQRLLELEKRRNKSCH